MGIYRYMFGSHVGWCTKRKQGYKQIASGVEFDEDYEAEQANNNYEGEV